jgi:hypothetical protein
VLSLILVLFFPVLLVAVPLRAIAYSLRVYVFASLTMVLVCIVVWQAWPNVVTVYHPPLGSSGYRTWPFPIAAIGGSALVGLAHLFRPLESSWAWAAIVPVCLLASLGAWIS